jgi:hypothetical protein
MTREEFRAKAIKYGYDENGIKELLEEYDEISEEVPGFSYEDIVLIEQPKY